VVLEFGRIEGFVVGGVEVVDTGLQTGIHDGQILVGERHVDHQAGLLTANQGHQLGDLVGVDLRRRHLDPLDFRGNGVAFALGAGGQGDG